MVFSHIAQKLGIWDILAPLTEEGRKQQQQQQQDEQFARKLQQQEEERYRRLKTQYDFEQKAEKINQFAKQQRVLYHYKAEDKWFDAVIVGVHLDDGPDKPYYVSIHYYFSICLNIIYQFV